MNTLSQYSRKPIIRLRNWLVFAGCISAITACGGGSSSSPAKSYTVSGTLTGLLTNKEIILKNNAADPLSLKTDGLFTFSQAVSEGGQYNVSISKFPFLQNCQVVNGVGQSYISDVTAVQVTCGAPVYKDVYDFGAQEALVSRLIEGHDGNMYGTTQYSAGDYAGTVFMITPQGWVNLHRFNLSGDGPKTPAGGLVQAKDGKFYGTSYNGGTFEKGTVYMIDPDETSFSKMKVLYNFNGTEGSQPYAGLIEDKNNPGTFYGTTRYGGTNDAGTVFKITVDGTTKNATFKNLHSLNGTTEGADARAGLVQTDDEILYGVTQSGGLYGGGVIYSVTLNGEQAEFKTRHSFLQNHTEGGAALSAMNVGIGGKLYGTTNLGGPEGLGSIFVYDPAGGSLKTLHFFRAQDGGGAPVSGLIQGSDGYLVGVTSLSNVFQDHGGILFKLRPDGTDFKILYSFDKTKYPSAELFEASNGNLYGSTSDIGTYHNGVIFTFGH